MGSPAHLGRTAFPQNKTNKQTNNKKIQTNPAFSNHNNNCFRRECECFTYLLTYFLKFFEEPRGGVVVSPDRLYRFHATPCNRAPIPHLLFYFICNLPKILGD
jgi:hypothetical protein